MSDVTFVTLQGATLALYAGMAPQELQLLVRAALHLVDAECAGFEVAARPPRLVPLAVACAAPQLLTGAVRALVTPRATFAQPSAEDDAITLKRLVKSALSELQLTDFEAALLEHKCELQRPKVLAELGGDSSSTLGRCSFGGDPPKPIARKTKKGKSPKKGVKQSAVASSSAKKRVRNAAAATPSAVSVVRSLHAQHMLTSLELDIVQALVAQDDSQVLQILRDFEQSDHRDVGALRDALVSIVEEITMELGDEEKAAAAFARGLDDAVREENPFMDSDDDSDSLGWQKHLSFLLGQWQAQHQLTPADASTLRKMVAQRHNLLESAYEVFAGDGDASELLDTLQRVAKLQRQIERSQAGQNVQNDGPASGLSLEDVVRQMQRRGVLQAGDAAGLLVLFHNGNEALQAANEAFLADGDVHELEETLLLVVKHAGFGKEAEESDPVDETQAVSRLLSDYGRSGRLELWQIQLLMSLLKSHDPRLLAAVDVYNEDQNNDELVDTLEILVELAAWERHRRAMVHDWIAPLARSGKLPRGGAERLVQLVKARDDRVVAALVVFLSDNNKDEFVDTLARIACLEAMKLKNLQVDTSQDESTEGHLVLALLKELEEKGIMSVEEREKIEELVCCGEPRMLAAMDVLAATHDEADFADTARRILAKSKDQPRKEGVKDGSVDAGASSEASPKSPKAEAMSECENASKETTGDVEVESQISVKGSDGVGRENEESVPDETDQPPAHGEIEASEELKQNENQEHEQAEEVPVNGKDDQKEVEDDAKDKMHEDNDEVVGKEEDAEVAEEVVTEEVKEEEKTREVTEDVAKEEVVKEQTDEKTN
ncbi:unnamed protein product [Phytophthora lilii]|uniref:Unnamed protein product n=1 Tax=Phytophthora lilii TaxID=2077276 RepID=A0A9W6U308_9STRA|nr:unnamed protein product [Phytophthora lilii]